jgi:hypothetical protein
MGSRVSRRDAKVRRDAKKAGEAKAIPFEILDYSLFCVSVDLCVSA